MIAEILLLIAGVMIVSLIIKMMRKPEQNTDTGLTLIPLALIIIALVLVLSSCTEEIEPCECSYEVRENAQWTNYEWELKSGGTYLEYFKCVPYDSVVSLDTMYLGNRVLEIRVQNCR